MDPLTLLPDELLPLILDLIPEQRVACMLVSRAWHDFILQVASPHLHVNLNERQLNDDSRRGLFRHLQLNPASFKMGS
ncbi:hypothetical protein BCR43DRAFT_489275 [Syncephalastrum racemosum]|uniref:F-box domain-containing protein n=1 Tax=Syncephalastrum racemosum TaxID=13706 RepID=A0A1X2HKA0_SYNRA|nr:hypothetical protein BCR43DRAFT_489275 [Syncephalastrum racemosum]